MEGEMKRLLIAALKTLTASSNLDLSKFEAAKEWAVDNIDGVSEIYDDEAYEDEDDEFAEVYKEKKQEETDIKIEEYMSKYSEVKNKTSIEIYRAVCLEDIKQLDLENIGRHWSFKREGVGCYEGNEKYPMFVLTGLANTKIIDWEYGFESFMWYGQDQWECALNHGSVTITHIDDKKLDKPLQAKVGNR
jgi:hypothetical protein